MLISLSHFAGEPERWHCKMLTVFLGYPFISIISALIGKILDVLHDSKKV